MAMPRISSVAWALVTAALTLQSVFLELSYLLIPRICSWCVALTFDSSLRFIGSRLCYFTKTHGALSGKIFMYIRPLEFYNDHKRSHCLFELYPFDAIAAVDVNGGT